MNNQELVLSSKVLKLRRIVVSGSRHFEDYSFFEEKMLSLDIFKQKCILFEGGQRGVDSLVRPFCIKNKQHIVTVDLLDWEWNDDGKFAGHLRNHRLFLIGQPELLIAFPGPNSKGTKNAINLAKELGIETMIFPVNK